MPRHAELVTPGVGEQRVAGALRGEAGLGPGLGTLHLEGAVLLCYKEGTRGQGGGGAQQQQPGPHPINLGGDFFKSTLKSRYEIVCENNSDLD